MSDSSTRPSAQSTELTPEQMAERAAEQTEAAAVVPGFGVDGQSFLEAWSRVLEEAADQPRAFLNAQTELAETLVEICQNFSYLWPGTPPPVGIQYLEEPGQGDCPCLRARGLRS